MLRRMALAVALIAVANTAHAQGGINLAWNDCITQPESWMIMNYACDGSRTGNPLRLIASFVAPDNLSQFYGIQMVLDVDRQFGTPSPGLARSSGITPLPDWWRLGVGECREGNLAFPASLTGIGTGTTGACHNPWAGAFTGGYYQYTSSYNGDPTRARLLTELFRDTPTTLTSGQHYLSGAITLDTGTDLPSEGYPQCVGCCDFMVIHLQQVELYQVAGQAWPQPDIYILSTPDIRQYVTWQEAGPCQQTPARRTSWGRIKTTYR